MHSCVPRRHSCRRSARINQCAFSSSALLRPQPSPNPLPLFLLRRIRPQASPRLGWTRPGRARTGRRGRLWPGRRYQSPLRAHARRFRSERSEHGQPRPACCHARLAALWPVHQPGRRHLLGAGWKSRRKSTAECKRLFELLILSATTAATHNWSRCSSISKRGFERSESNSGSTRRKIMEFDRSAYALSSSSMARVASPRAA